MGNIKAERVGRGGGDGEKKIGLITFFVAEDGDALYTQQKKDLELTLPQIVSSLLQNSDLS